jgi:predicted lipoprotein with Yx(FWY)xxD motif
VDSNSRTLDLFEKDANHRSACYGTCASYWPPLLTHGKPVARARAKQCETAYHPGRAETSIVDG